MCGQVAAVVGRLAADEHVVMRQYLVVRQPVVAVVVGRLEQVLHFLERYLAREESVKGLTIELRYRGGNTNNTRTSSYSNIQETIFFI